MQHLEDITFWALRASLPAGVLALALWAIYRSQRTRHLYGLQYVLGMLILTRLCLPSIPSTSLHPLNWFQTKQGTVLPHSAAYEAPQKPANSEIPHIPPATTPNAASQEVANVSPNSLISWRDLLALLWLSGCLLGAFRLTAAHIRHHRLFKACEPLVDPLIEKRINMIQKKLGIHQRIQVFTSPHIATAAVSGTIRPKLILSDKFVQELTPQQQAHVVTHELVHVKHFDPLLNWLTLVVQAIHWFNPLTHWALKKFQHDRELICDAKTIQILGEQERSAYGDTLIAILTSFRPQKTFPNLVPMISNKNEIKRRIIMISKNQTKDKRPSFLFAGLAIILAVTFTGPSPLIAEGPADREPQQREFTELQSPESELELELDYIIETEPGSASRLRLGDASSRVSGHGILVAPGSGRQMYNVHEIDLRAFGSGGLLLIDITMGDGECAGSFDLFPEGVPLPSGSPNGSVAHKYDVPPGAKKTLVHQFAKGQVFRFGASGNWFSEKGSTNEFEFEARAVALPSQAANTQAFSSLDGVHFRTKVSKAPMREPHPEIEVQKSVNVDVTPRTHKLIDTRPELDVHIEEVETEKSITLSPSANSALSSITLEPESHALVSPDGKATIVFSPEKKRTSTKLKSKHQGHTLTLINGDDEFIAISPESAITLRSRSNGENVIHLKKRDTNQWTTLETQSSKGEANQFQLKPRKSKKKVRATSE